MSFHPTTAEPPPLRQIRAFVSDVDGTLVTSEKRLSPRTIETVAALRRRGILFSIVSSRPPRGLERIVDTLAIDMPIAAFNGGILLNSNMNPIEENLLSGAIARHAVDELTGRGLKVWLFNGEHWYVGEGANPYVARERRALQFDPILVSDFEPVLAGAAKIVGLSADFNLVERCEKELGRTLAGNAAVVRSQGYALDITHPLANKGAALAKIAQRMATPLSAVAVIGDGGNDLAMFALGGVSVAMGNAAPGLRDAADFVTASNDDDGFSEAAEHLFPRARASAWRP